MYNEDKVDNIDVTVEAIIVMPPDKAGNRIFSQLCCKFYGVADDDQHHFRIPVPDELAARMMLVMDKTQKSVPLNIKFEVVDDPEGTIYKYEGWIIEKTVCYPGCWKIYKDGYAHGNETWRYRKGLDDAIRTIQKLEGYA